MSTIFLAAFALQWVALVALGILIVALMRQVGMLHERLGPVGALTLPGGPGVGESAPQFTLPSLTGGSVTIGGSTTDGKSMLLFFLSPDCPVCKSLLPVLREIASASRPYLKLIFASDGDEPRQTALIAKEKLTDYPFVLSTELGLAHAVGKLPYAILIGADGKIVAKGLVNNREHIESLFEAQRSGIASIQEYLARRTAGQA